MRSSFFFPLLRRIRINRLLARVLLFLASLIMLALGLQPHLLLLAVIKWRRRKSDIEISNREIIRTCIVFFRAQGFLQSFDRISRQRLDGKERARRRSARDFRAILIEQRQRL